MEMKQKVMVIASVALVSAAIGRYTAPEKIKIETKTVEVIKEVKVKDETETKKKDKTYTKTTDTKPTGEKTETVTIVEKDADKTKTDVTIAKDDNKSTDQIKEVTKSSGHLNLSVLAGVNVLSPGGMLYGGHITRDILGPINIGIWGLSNGTAGCSVGLTF
jgi:lipopolysaccharide export LptBFGC system permease protein LptF